MWAILYLECAIFYQAIHTQSLVITAQSKGDPNLAQHRTRLQLVGGENLPRVDILVPCCGEPLEFILDTLYASCRIDYPSKRFRVIVLDDGQSMPLRKAVGELQQTWGNIHYQSRGLSPDRQDFAKAGNLNFALFDLEAPTEGPSEYIAILDADFMPSPNFLRSTLPHLMKFPKLALVGTPQYFYNIPAGDPLAQGLGNWQGMLLPQLNQLGVAINGGSGCVIRRDLLLEHQGFPTISMAEDLMLSLVLIGTGSQLIVLDDILQLGRVPASLQGHVSQRRRWCISLSQQVMALKRTKENTVPSALRWSIACQGIFFIIDLVNRALAFIMIPLALLSDQPLVPAASRLELKIQGCLAVMSLTFMWGFEWLMMARSDFRAPAFSHLEELWMAPGQLYALICFYLLPAQSPGSLVTGSALNPWNTTSISGRRLHELKRNLWDAGVAINLTSFVFIITAVLHAIRYAMDNYEQSLRFVATGLLWPPVLHICYLLISSNWIPLSCTAWPVSWPTHSSRPNMKSGPRGAYAILTQPEVQQAHFSHRLSRFGYAGHYILIFLGLFVLFGAFVAV
ncbi:hypothetical protein PMG11_07016 [Penicillium brasilianum]|uniref:Glycosyltransferase 2-like domain-containing protein n=1 Tax=Penicillium brasilianum TaxID=104259 RepID=A0A0F7TTG0_PENBI|nr:hypothetical protein PMG11_07016 [Penicillium brasilianum]